VGKDKKQKSRRGRTAKSEFHHVGVLINEPPGKAELLFIPSID
jgi:hypothetical protein